MSRIFSFFGIWSDWIWGRRTSRSHTNHQQSQTNEILGSLINPSALGQSRTSHKRSRSVTVYTPNTVYITHILIKIICFTFVNSLLYCYIFFCVIGAKIFIVEVSTHQYSETMFWWVSHLNHWLNQLFKNTESLRNSKQLSGLMSESLNHWVNWFIQKYWITQEPNKLTVLYEWVTESLS